MNEDGKYIQNRTWNRAIQPIHNIGYMDGAANGQMAVHQPSFDMGYAQGLCFGFEWSFRKGISIQSNANKPVLTNSQRINCQICVNNTMMQETVGNLYNYQQESNLLLFQRDN